QKDTRKPPQLFIHIKKCHSERSRGISGHLRKTAALITRNVSTSLDMTELVMAFRNQRERSVFVGHYSVAFAARSERNTIPLWVLFVAVQFLDYIWATLVLLGIEKLRVIKGFTAGSMLDSYFHPYSHSLITAILWSSVAALVFKAICSRHPIQLGSGQASPLQ